MWKCIFDSATNIGVAFNREPLAGEYRKFIAPEKCGMFNLAPHRYKFENNLLVEVDGWEQEEADREAARTAAAEALAARVAAIESAKSSSNLKQYTVEQAEEWITNTLTDAPNTTVGVKQAVGKILIRILPYIVPKE
jgi:hypothetical protein